MRRKISCESKEAPGIHDTVAGREETPVDVQERDKADGGAARQTTAKKFDTGIIANLRQKITRLQTSRRAMGKLITNMKLVEDMKHVTCPVCLNRVLADRSYAAPYRHLLKHLIPAHLDEEW